MYFIFLQEQTAFEEVVIFIPTLIILGQLTKEGKLPVSKEDSESEEEENVLTKKEKRRKREQRAKDRKQKQHLLHRPTKDLWSCKEDNDKCI